jgi:hypothetical protein
MAIGGPAKVRKQKAKETFPDGRGGRSMGAGCCSRQDLFPGSVTGGPGLPMVIGEDASTGLRSRRRITPFARVEQIKGT